MKNLPQAQNPGALMAQGMVDAMVADTDDLAEVRRELRACGYSAKEATAMIREAKRVSRG